MLNKILETIAFWIFIIFHPSYWLMNDKYSKGWDKELNSLLRCYTFKNITSYSAYLGSTKIWIENHPYASFTKYKLGQYHPDESNVRPSRRTLKKAYEALQYDKIGLL